MSKLFDILIYTVIVFSAVILAVILFRLVQGNFLNSYPYISPDGFDWIYEGAYLRAVLSGWASSELPPPFLLRQPIFVLVTALDAAAGSRGIIIIVCMAISFALTAVAINQILVELGVSPLIRLWGTIAFIMSPLNFYAYWVLSDQLAIMLMMVSTYLLIKSDCGLNRKTYIVSTIVAVLAGLTQLYGLIPFALGTILFFVYRRLKYKQFTYDILVISAVAAGIWATILYFWFKIIPHEGYATQLAKLELSLDMLDFYINTWIFGFGPLLIVCMYAILTAKSRLRVFSNVNDLLMLSIVIFFSIMAFIYQWPEARFSFLYQGFVIILTCILIQNITRTSAVSSYVTVGVTFAALCTIVIGGVLLVPDNYWQPRLAHLRVNGRGSWLGAPINASAIDRFRLQATCSSRVHFCTGADATAIASIFGFYVLRETTDYRKLMLFLGE